MIYIGISPLSFHSSIRMLALVPPLAPQIGLLTPASLQTVLQKWMKVTNAYLSADFFPPDNFSSTLPFKSNWNLTVSLRTSFLHKELKARSEAWLSCKEDKDSVGAFTYGWHLSATLRFYLLLTFYLVHISVWKPSWISWLANAPTRRHLSFMLLQHFLENSTGFSCNTLPLIRLHLLLRE